MVEDIKKNLGWAFFNEPRELRQADYTEALQKITSKYSQNNDILSIYDWGNPSQPGISDLDVLFIIRESAKRPLPFNQRSFMLLESQSRYIARHPFQFITESDFRDIGHIYPSGNLRRIHGKEIRRNTLGNSQKEHILRALLNDIIVRHYPRDFLEQQLSKRMNVRDSMLRLNSLKYTFQTIANLIRKKNGEWGAFARDVQNLRKDWFSSRDHASLISLCSRSIGIMMDIIGIAKDESSKQYKRQAGQLSEKIQYAGIKNKSMFIKNWNKEDAIEEMENTLKKTGRHTSILPLELAPQLVFYANQKGRMSSYIKSHLRPFQKIQMENEILEKRMKILNSQAELTQTLRHSDFPAFFDFGYRSTTGINNMLLRMADKVRF